jgi:MFS family permease
VTQIGCALSKNIETMVILRMLGGILGSSPLVIVGGILADLWESYRRGQAMAMFSATTFLGPTLGPFIAGYLSMSGAEGWRWMFWLLTIFGGVSTLVLFLTMPETYAPYLLKEKARRIRALTGDEMVYATLEREEQGIMKLLQVTLSRPFQLLFGDVIIFLVCLYLSFCYGVQYQFFQVSHLKRKCSYRRIRSSSRTFTN